MPASKIKKDVREGVGSKKTLEKKWDRAKDAAKKSAKDPKDSWALTMHIYKNMTHQASNAFTVSACTRLLATLDDDVDPNYEVSSDSFEGWVNTLQYKYDRPEGEDHVVVDATYDEVVKKLTDQEWEEKGEGEFTKGEHSVKVKEEGDKAKIISIASSLMMEAPTWSSGMKPGDTFCYTGIEYTFIKDGGPTRRGYVQGQMTDYGGGPKWLPMKLVDR